MNENDKATNSLDDNADLAPKIPSELQMVTTTKDKAQSTQEAKDLKDRQLKALQMVMQNMEPNPLKGLPANMPCPCKSGKKFKVCHRNQLPPVVTKKTAEFYRKILL